jgi:hypothetical protein
MLDVLIKDSYKRTKRLSRSSSQVPPTGSPGGGEARFARLIQQHQQQRLLTARVASEHDREREIVRISRRSRSPMEVELADTPRASVVYGVEGAQTALREEDKEEDGTVEGIDNAGNVVV